MHIKVTLLFLLIWQFNLNAQNSYKKAIEACQEKGFIESQECMKGEAIPDFESTTYVGERIGKKELKNKVAIINFWFVACPPCIAELDGLNQMVNKYKNNEEVEFLAFTTDKKKILEEEFFSNYKLDFKIIPDATELIFDTFQLRWGFPTTLIVDKSGRIYKIKSGGKTTEKEASEEIIRFLTNGIEECLKK